MTSKYFIFVIIGACTVALSGCHTKSSTDVPAFSETPKIEKVKTADMPELIPGYGIITDGMRAPEFEVNIEAGDSHLIHVGQDATVYLTPSKQTLKARVVRILKNASAETGQAIAWLKPTTGQTAKLEPGSFIFSEITVGIKRRAVIIPKGALFIRGGKTWVILVKTKDGKQSFHPTLVRVEEDDSRVFDEVLSGVSAGDSIVTRGAIGFLYPDFKAEADD